MQLKDRVRVIDGGQPFIDEIGRVGAVTPEGLVVVVFSDSEGIEFCSFPFQPTDLEPAPLLPADAFLS